MVKPNPGFSEAPARWVVVVPLGDVTMFEYLTKSFASVRDVTVVLERRRRQPASEVPGNDRRAQPRVVSTFGCSVIRRSALVLDAPASRGETVLWPNLRITDVLTWTEESEPRGTETRSAH